MLLIVSVLSSGAATSQATIMPAARTTLSMASHGALPKAFGRVHPKYQTPSVTTWTFGLVSLALYVLLASWSRNVLADSVDAVVGGVFFLAVLVLAAIAYAKPDAGETTVFGIGGVAVIGVVAILVGIPLMFAVQRVCRDFFAGRRLTRGAVARDGQTIES